MAESAARPIPGLPLVIAAHLRDLAVDLSEGGYTPTTLALLTRDLRRRVPSALGSTIELTRGSTHPGVQLNLVARVVHPDEIRSAIRVPLPSPMVSFTASITIYARQPEALNDLAVELAAILEVPVDEHPVLSQRAIEPGTAGLTDFTLVNIALGHLLNRGRTIDQARAELARHALDHKSDLAGAARELLDGSWY